MAKHPKTGKLIKILQSEGQVWRNGKTLVWLGQTTLPMTSYARYETAVSNMKDLQTWVGIVVPDIVVFTEPSAEILDWLRGGHWRKHRIVFLGRSVVEEFDAGEFAAIGMTNTICLDEVHEVFPFVELPWNGSEQDARIIAALILRCCHTFPATLRGTVHSSVATKHGLSVSEECTVPPLIVLITQYYVPDKPKRAREIKECLQRNIDNPLIDKILLLNESPQDLPKSPKILENVIGARLTYADVIKFIKNEVIPNTIVIFANSDIYYDETLRLLYSVNMRDVFMSLLRYEVTDSGTPKLFGPRGDSQDTWIVLSDSIHEREWVWGDLDFPFGKGGCDNAINTEMMRAKMCVVNPALTIKTYHLHKSGVRTYDPTDIVEKPVYVHVNPTGLHDLRPVFTFPNSFVQKFLEPEQFPRRIRGLASDAERTTFCTMLARDTPFKLAAEARNAWPEVDKRISILKFEDCFQTSQGLPYGYNELWLGQSKRIADGWSTSMTSTLSHSVGTRVGLVACLSAEAAADPVKYMLTYLAKIFWLREETGHRDGSFWGVNRPDFVDVMKAFVWPNKKVPVVEWSAGAQIFSQKAVMWYPQEEYQITREEIFLLREFVSGGWLKAAATTEERRIVVFVDGIQITDAWVTQFELAVGEYITVECIYPTTAVTAVCEHLRGAMAAVVFGGKKTHARWGWFWMLPRDAIVYDIQTDINPCAELFHLVSAGGGRHSLVVVPRAAAAMTATAARIGASFCETTGACDAEFGPAPVPTIYVPDHPTGFFHHGGDSFREMVDLWAEKGYVKVVKDESVYNVWLGGVGETLLYDRPTIEWYQKSPAREQKWTRALFGNPAPMGVNAYAWSFWPRRPRLVEELAPTATASFAERKKHTVFYGKIENAVQDVARRGKGEDWSYICDEFDLVIGSAAKYKYTQREYLEALAGARFGLCLPGFGKKCHREVECMAMGCVPVITPDVDITHYANPPEEGLHFVRVDSPEDAYEKLAKISRASWEVMSAACKTWWKRNASCDGMWELTKQLSGTL